MFLGVRSAKAVAGLRARRVSIDMLKRNYRIAGNCEGSGLTPAMSPLPVRPDSFRKIEGDWSLDMPFCADFITMHSEYKNLVPYSCPMQECCDDGKRHKDSSWIEVKLPFSSDSSMVQHLARAKGHKVRYGKLFEIIDAVAGDVAYRHTRGIDATLVTAAVDGMTAISDITTTEDLTIQAFLTYVGSSSLEIHVNMLQPKDGEDKLVGSTQFIFVARTRDGDSAHPVPGLKLSSQEDEAEFERGKQRALARREKSKSSLEVTPPRTEEVQSIHKLFLRSREMKSEKRKLMFDLKDGVLDHANLLANFKYMDTTRRQSVNLMHGHNRNIHGKVFGGEIMRLSYELAYVTAVCFLGKGNTRFSAVDDINFIRPVEVGSIMEFTGTVTYSNEDSGIVVLVTAEEVDPQTDVRIKTNQMSYHFSGVPGKQVTEVIPRNYEEFILYLMGRRTCMPVPPPGQE